MASNAFSGVGTKFHRLNTTLSSPAYQTIAEINSITGPGMSRATIDVTSLDSTGGYREFIASFKDAGELQLEMNFTRVTYEVMLADFESEQLRAYAIELPDAANTTLEFNGFVTAAPVSIPLDDKVTSTVTIKISGAVTLSSGAPTP